MERLFQKPLPLFLSLRFFLLHLLCNRYSIQSMQNWEYCRQWSYFETWHDLFQDKASIYHFIYNPCFICYKSSTIIWSIYRLTKFKNSTVTGIYGKNKEILSTVRSIFAFLYSRRRHICKTAWWSKVPIERTARSTTCLNRNVSDILEKIYCKKRFKQFYNIYNIRMVYEIFS